MKIESYGDDVTDFYGKEIGGSDHTSLEVISLDSPFNKDKNCYPQVFLK